MNGTAIAVSGEGTIRAILGQSGPSLTPQILAQGRQEVGQALNSTGFVYLAGQHRENFQTYLDREPFEIEVGPLKPGVLPDLVSWVAGKIAADPDQAQQAQARVQPERAVKLLT
jgi:hypothetical protein